MFVCLYRVRIGEMVYSEVSLRMTHSGTMRGEVRGVGNG